MDEKLAFTVEDILKLFEAAQKASVSEFQGGGVNFRLVNDPFIRASLKDNAPTLRPQKDFDQLLIEDPKAFEEAMREID